MKNIFKPWKYQQSSDKVPIISSFIAVIFDKSLININMRNKLNKQGTRHIQI